MYGIDSYGFTCGSKVSWRNETLDLRPKRNLYYLNPLALLLSGRPAEYAKRICADSCPETGYDPKNGFCLEDKCFM